MPGRTIGDRVTWHPTGGNFTPARLVLIDHLRAGVPFDRAWPAALAACDPDDRATLRETTAAWRAEYERRNSYGGDLMSTARMALDLDAGQHDQRILA